MNETIVHHEYHFTRNEVLEALILYLEKRNFSYKSADWREIDLVMHTLPIAIWKTKE